MLPELVNMAAPEAALNRADTPTQPTAAQFIGDRASFELHDEDVTTLRRQFDALASLRGGPPPQAREEDAEQRAEFLKWQVRACALKYVNSQCDHSGDSKRRGVGCKYLEQLQLMSTAARRGREHKHQTFNMAGPGSSTARLDCRCDLFCLHTSSLSQGGSICCATLRTSSL